MKHLDKSSDVDAESKSSGSSGSKSTLSISNTSAPRPKKDQVDFAVLKSDWDRTQLTDILTAYKYARANNVVRMTGFRKLKSDLHYEREKFASQGGDPGSWWVIATGSV